MRSASFLGVTLALGLGAAIAATPAHAAPSYVGQLEAAYSTPPTDPTGQGLPSTPLAGNLVFDLANTGTGLLAPVLGPVLGNQGLQGLLVPLLGVGLQGLALLPQLPLGDAALPGGPSLLGVIVPAAAPAVVGLLTLDPALLVSGGISFVDVLLTQLVPGLLGSDGLVSGLLGGNGGLLIGVLGPEGLVSGLLGGSGGLLGGNGGLLVGVLGPDGLVSGLLGGVLGPQGLVSGLLGGNGGLLGGNGGLLVGNGGLLGGVLGPNGLVSGVLGGVPVLGTLDGSM